MTKRSMADAAKVARELSSFESSRLCALAFGNEELDALVAKGLVRRWEDGAHAITPLGTRVAQALQPDDSEVSES